MKKAMLHTKVSVRLRKSEIRDEWYLYLEAYPVFKAGHDKPCREREYLNRTITTPTWDKSHRCLRLHSLQLPALPAEGQEVLYPQDGQHPGQHRSQHLCLPRLPKDLPVASRTHLLVLRQGVPRRLCLRHQPHHFGRHPDDAYEGMDAVRPVPHLQR